MGCANAWCLQRPAHIALALRFKWGGGTSMGVDGSLDGMILRFLKWALLLTLLAALAALGALALALQTEALVQPQPQPSANDVARVRTLLRSNDPRQVLPNVLPNVLPDVLPNGMPNVLPDVLPNRMPRQLKLGEAELNLLLGHLVLRWPQAAAEVALQPGRALVRASIPTGPLWLNFNALLGETSALPSIERLRIGRLPVPAFAANVLLARALRGAPDGRGGELPMQLATELVEHIAFGAQYLRVSYHWQADSLDRMLAGLWPAAEQQRIKAYHERLTAVAVQHPPGAAVSLADLMAPMFAVARERMAQGSGDAAAENRAAMLTLALFANGRSWASVMPAARAWPPARPLRVTLFGRDDFPLHFLISAVLAIEGGGPLADAIGVDKELVDARSGSGFSFNDIAADRAGTRFGLLATQAPVRLQAAIGQGLQERDFMPEVADLPEFMREADFAKRYGGVGAPGYSAMMKEIEGRLDGLAVFR